MNYRDVEDFPVTYIKDQINGLKDKYNITATKMAEIMGYERAALHRMMKCETSGPNIIALFRLSQHFGLDMNYWFPPESVRNNPTKWPSPADVGRCLFVDLQPNSAPLSAKILEMAEGTDCAGKKRMLAAAEEPVANGLQDAVAQKLHGLSGEQLADLSTIIDNPMQLNLLSRVAKVTPEGLRKSLHSA